MTDAVTILGSGSALPTYQNSPSGQMLTLNDKSFLIDCGEGVQLTMRRKLHLGNILYLCKKVWVWTLRFNLVRWPRIRTLSIG